MLLSIAGEGSRHRGREGNRTEIRPLWRETPAIAYVSPARSVAEGAGAKHPTRPSVARAGREAARSDAGAKRTQRAQAR